jgi:hypothetical protein
MASGPVIGRYGNGVTRLWRKAGPVPGHGAARRGGWLQPAVPPWVAAVFPLAMVLDPGPDPCPRLAWSQPGGPGDAGELAGIVP